MQISTKWRRALGNVALILISSAVALLLCELGFRLVLNPVDYLSPTLVRDDILGIRLPGNSSGHDQWGFRNQKVPETAEIVAVGDSHTYGNCAKMNEAWPQVLGNLSGKSVYNLGMGGYGPNQYCHLLQTRGLGLKPHVVICGIYMGDDFDNAYRITYGLDHWAALRDREMKGVDPDIWEKETSGRPSLQRRVRIWLSANSMIYRLTIHGLLQKAKGRYQIQNAAELYEGATTLVLPEQNIEEAFSPKGLLRGLDQGQASVREGMRITSQLLRQMNALCASNHVRFIVAVIPTKETVFARHLEHNSKLKLSETLDQLIANERMARKEFLAGLARDGIHSVDLLPALERASKSERLYAYTAADMHPNSNGYRVIAATLAESLNSTNR